MLPIENKCLDFKGIKISVSFPVIPTPCEMGEYLYWAVETLGIKSHPSVQVFEVPCGDGERGLRASADIEASSSDTVELICIPRDAIMTRKDVPEPFIRFIVPEMREDDALALILLFEKHEMKERSKWAPHISILPHTYHSIVNWSSEDLESLRGSNLYTTATLWKRQVEEDFEVITRSLFDDDLLPKPSWFTKAEYVWALSTIWSRFITMDDGCRGMVPVVDLLNHMPQSQVGHVNKSGSGGDHEDFSLFTAQSWKGGEEIFLNYGNSSSERLLMLYGFSLPQNPFESVTLFAKMDPSAEGIALKKEALFALGILPNKSAPTDTLRFELTPEDPLPSKLMAFMRINHCKYQDSSSLPKLLKVARLCSGPTHATAAAAVEKVLIEMIEAYIHAPAEDEGKEGEGSGVVDAPPLFLPPCERRAHSAILIKSEKAILVKALQRAKDFKTK